MLAAWVELGRPTLRLWSDSGRIGCRWPDGRRASWFSSLPSPSASPPPEPACLYGGSSLRLFVFLSAECELSVDGLTGQRQSQSNLARIVLAPAHHTVGWRWAECGVSGLRASAAKAAKIVVGRHSVTDVCSLARRTTAVPSLPSLPLQLPVTPRPARSNAAYQSRIRRQRSTPARSAAPTNSPIRNPRDEHPRPTQHPASFVHFHPARLPISIQLSQRQHPTRSLSRRVHGTVGWHTLRTIAQKARHGDVRLE